MGLGFEEEVGGGVGGEMREERVEEEEGWAVVVLEDSVGFFCESESRGIEGERR